MSDIDDVPADLARLRSSIDNIDAALLHLLAEQPSTTRRPGRVESVSAPLWGEGRGSTGFTER